MAHYLVEVQNTGDLETNYPHSPENHPASLADYLEYRFSTGWSLLCVHTALAGTVAFVFTPNAA